MVQFQLLIALVFSLTIINGSTLGSTGNTVNKVCCTNTTCTGVNEYCKVSEQFSPACSLGTCQCLPCYALDASSTCSPVQPKKLGDACDGDPTEVLIVRYSECFGNVVVCQDGYMANGTNYCVVDMNNPRLPEGAPCSFNSDCQGEMWCGWNNVCECSMATYRFDDRLNRCIRREFGDACSFDSDCQVNGATWSGYTFSSGGCRDGSCDCATFGSKQVNVTYIDPATGDLVFKLICIVTGGATDLENGTSCSLDPIYEGNSKSVRVCANGLVCSRCPEDANTNAGICRYLTSPEPTPVCFLKPDPLPAVDLSNVSPVPYTRQARTTTPSPYASMPWADFFLASIVNHTWTVGVDHLRQCSSSATCWDYEVCLMPYLCGRGVCACVPPNYLDDAFACHPPPENWSPRPTTTSTSTTTSTPTESTTVGLTRRTLPSSDSTSTTTTTKPSTTTKRLFSYGMRCYNTSECAFVGQSRDYTIIGLDNGLVCRSNGSTHTYCLCPSAQYYWHPQRGVCKLREFGDPCCSDSECDNGVYTKRVVGGFACLPNGVCGCSEGYSAVDVAILGAAWGESTVPQYVAAPPVRTYCLLTSQHSGNLPAGSNCTLQLAERSSDHTFTCAKGLTCLACPLDALQTFHGTCFKFVAPSEVSTPVQSVFNNRAPLLLVSTTRLTLTICFIITAATLMLRFT